MPHWEVTLTMVVEGKDPAEAECAALNTLDPDEKHGNRLRCTSVNGPRDEAEDYA
jgi:hypothetical protein